MPAHLLHVAASTHLLISRMRVKGKSDLCADSLATCNGIGSPADSAVRARIRSERCADSLAACGGIDPPTDRRGES